MDILVFEYFVGDLFQTSYVLGPQRSVLQNEEKLFKMMVCDQLILKKIAFHAKMSQNTRYVTVLIMN